MNKQKFCPKKIAEMGKQNCFTTFCPALKKGIKFRHCPEGRGVSGLPKLFGAFFIQGSNCLIFYRCTTVVLGKFTKNL